VAGQVVWPGEAAFPAVIADPERRVLLRRLVTDRGAGQHVDARQAGIDGGGQLSAPRQGTGVALVPN
jgi:hypothetical protein